MTKLIDDFNLSTNNNQFFKKSENNFHFEKFKSLSTIETLKQKIYFHKNSQFKIRKKSNWFIEILRVIFLVNFFQFRIRGYSCNEKRVFSGISDLIKKIDHIKSSNNEEHIVETLLKVKNILLEILRSKFKKDPIKNKAYLYLQKNLQIKIEKFFPKALEKKKIENFKSVIHDEIQKKINLFQNFLEGMIHKNDNKIQFNKFLSQNYKDKNLTKIIQHAIKNLDEKDLKLFLNLSLRDLRGYNRVFVKKILNEILLLKKDNFNSDEITLLETLIKKIKCREINILPENKILLGSGVNNTVYKVSYFNNDFPKHGVFKPDLSNITLLKKLKENYFSTAVGAGIPQGPKAYFSDRAVASSIVDKALYGKKRISVKTSFVSLNGEQGIMMDLAEGNKIQLENIHYEEINDIKNYEEKDLTPLKLHKICLKRNYRKIIIKKDNDKIKHMGMKFLLKGIDFNNPKTMKDLLKLQIKDIITGECDRHPQNYIIDNNGKVKGIDEDCSFGIHAIPKNIDVRKQPNMSLIPNKGSLMLRMPPVVTEKIKENVDRLYLNRIKLQKKLKAYLSGKEVKETLIRLEALKKHIEGNSIIVKKTADLLNHKTYLNTNNSYWARELMVYDPREKNWNHLRKFREL